MAVWGVMGLREVSDICGVSQEAERCLGLKSLSSLWGVWR